MTVQHNSRVVELDLLRFIAAFAVVLFHYTFAGVELGRVGSVTFPLLGQVGAYGFLGIELFFMISGFVIFASVAKRQVKGFAVARFIRLYPTYWLAVFLTSVVMLLMADGRLGPDGHQFLWNLSMVQEGLGVEHIDPVYWTLFVELKFYVLVALIMLTGQMVRIRLLLWVWFVIALFLYQLAPDHPLSDWLNAEWAFYFIAGIVTFLMRRDGFNLRDGVLFCACYIAVVWQVVDVLALFQQLYEKALAPWVVAIIKTLFFLLFLHLAHGGRVHLPRAVLMLGALTYPLYLLHQQIGYLLMEAASAWIAPVPLLGGTIVLMLTGAYLVRRFFEVPIAAFLRRRWLSASD